MPTVGLDEKEAVARAYRVRVTLSGSVWLTVHADDESDAIDLAEERVFENADEYFSQCKEIDVDAESIVLVGPVESDEGR